MKKTLIKLLSLLIATRYGLIAKQSWQDSGDPARIRTKILTVGRSLKFLGLVDNGISLQTISADYSNMFRSWLALQACLLFLGVWWLLCGHRKGLYVIIGLTVLGLALEANPAVDYSFEVDKTEAVRQAKHELAIVGCLLVLAASSSFKYARIVKFSP